MKNFLSLCQQKKVHARLFTVYFFILLGAFFFSIKPVQVFSEEDAIPAVESHKKSFKVLVLIISSDGTEAYRELQKVWKSYMHSDPAHFEVYFIKGNPELPTPFEIKGDDLFVKTEEGYVPGIVNKTILSMEAMLPRLKEFDYVLRTNLSSFYVFPRLLNFVSTLPKKKCYCGIRMHIPGSWIPKFGYTINFVSGAGFLLSSDLVEMLVREKEDIFKFNNDLPDDVLIGLFFQNRSIHSIPAERMDIPTRDQWIAQKDKIPERAFHFRAKNNNNIRTESESFSDELYINLELLKMFYAKPSAGIHSIRIELRP